MTFTRSRKYLVVIGVGILCVMLVSPALARRIKLASYFGPDHAASIAVKEKFIPIVETRTNGAIQVYYFPSCQLGHETEFTQSTRAGTIELAIFGNMLENTLPRLKTLQMPFAFKDPDHMVRVLKSPIGEELMGQFPSIGIIPLAGFSQGAVHLGNNKRPIHSIEDCEGLRFRVWEGETIIDMMEAIGITTMVLPLTEVYTALEQGIVDGVPNSILNFRHMGWYDQIKYITILNIMVFPNYYVASEKFWKSITDKEQQIIKEAAQASAEYTMDILKRQENETINWFRGKWGIEVYENIDAEPFRKATDVVWEKYYKKYPWMADLRKKISTVE